MFFLLYSVIYPPLLKEKKLWVQVLSHRVFSFLEVVRTQCLYKVLGWIRVVSLFSLPLISKLSVGSFSVWERCERDIDTFPPIFLSITLTLSHFLYLSHLNTRITVMCIDDVFEFHRLFITAFVLVRRHHGDERCFTQAGVFNQNARLWSVKKKFFL